MTDPIDKIFEGPAPPTTPSIPLGKVKLRIAADDVPTFVTDAGVEALTVEIVPIVIVPDGPCGPGWASK